MKRIIPLVICIGILIAGCKKENLNELNDELFYKSKLESLINLKPMPRDQSDQMIDTGQSFKTYKEAYEYFSRIIGHTIRDSTIVRPVVDSNAKTQIDQAQAGFYGTGSFQKAVVITETIEQSFGFSDIGLSYWLTFRGYRELIEYPWGVTGGFYVAHSATFEYVNVLYSGTGTITSPATATFNVVPVLPGEDHFTEISGALQGHFSIGGIPLSFFILLNGSVVLRGYGGGGSTALGFHIHTTFTAVSS